MHAYFPATIAMAGPGGMPPMSGRDARSIGGESGS